MKSKLKEYIIATLSIIIVGLICNFVIINLSYQSVSLLFIFNIFILSIFVKTDVILYSAFLSSISWNYFFIPPLYTFYIDKTEDILMFATYFIIAIITGILNSKIRQSQLLAVQQEKNTQVLFEHTKNLSSSNTKDEIINSSIKKLKEFFNIDSNIYIIDNEKISNKNINPKEYAIISWVFDNQEKAGKSTTILQDAGEKLYYPLYTNHTKIGVIEIQNSFDIKNKEELFQTFVYQISSALEREILNEKAQKARLIDESERLYSTLFNSISHELKIPISVLKAGIESLKDQNISKDQAIRELLINEIDTATERLNNLVSNLLDMSRLESGLIMPNIDWHDINDLISNVLKNFKTELQDNKISLEIDDNVDIVKLDFGLIDQALFNIIHNAIIYNDESIKIKITVKIDASNLIISIKDNGKGIDEQYLEKIFDKFYRINSSITGGSGLGLSIVKGFILAHQGTINAQNIYFNDQIIGLEFIISLPII